MHQTAGLDGKRLNDLASGAHREMVYPWDVDGASLLAGAAAWGESVVLLPVDTLDDNYGYGGGGSLVPFKLIGFYIVSSAGPTLVNTWQVFKIKYSSETLLDVDSGAGEVNPDRIYVGFTDEFQADDLVWIVDPVAFPAGEIADIDSIVTDDYLICTGALSNVYLQANGSMVYLIRRATDDSQRSIWGKFSMANTKETLKDVHHGSMSFSAGDGVLLRAYGIDGASTMLFTIIYDDEVD